MRNLLDALCDFHHRSSYECSKCKEGSVHLTLTTIFCRCQRTVQLPPVPKPIQLKQTTSPKTAKKCFKGNYITTMYFVLCIICCVSQYCVVPTIKYKICFKGNYITMYFVLCIVCCVVYCLLCITVCVTHTQCCANNQMQIFSTKFNFLYINIQLYLCKFFNVFSSVVGFSMSACSVRFM